MMDPGDISWLILPDSVALSGMIIFIASTSTKGSPEATSAPSSWRNRTTLPVMSDLSSLDRKKKTKDETRFRLLMLFAPAWPQRRAGRFGNGEQDEKSQF